MKINKINLKGDKNILIQDAQTGNITINMTNAKDLETIISESLKNNLLELLKNNKNEEAKIVEYENTILNGNSVESFETLSESYLDEIEHIDLVLKKKRPSRNEVLFVLGLIEQNKNYRDYFFREVSNIFWFPILKEQDYFTVNKIPQSQKEGDIIWPAANYLVKITDNISANENKDVILDILNIIKEFSSSNIVNSHIWVLHLKIVLNLPKEFITDDVLNLIPIWLIKSKEHNNNSYLSSQICNNLLKKFLNENSTATDIVKSELILKHIFTTEKESASISNKLIVYKHWVIAHIINNKETLDLIVTKCSMDTIIYLADKLKEILFNFNKTHTYYLHIDKKEFPLKITIINKKLEIELSENKTILETQIITSFENTEETRIYEIIVELLNKHIKCELNEDIKDTISHISNFEHFDDTSIWLKYFSKLGRNSNYMDKAEEIILLALRNFVLAKAKHNNITDTLKGFLVDDKYRLPVFKKLALFVISKNWNDYKALFWEVLDRDLITNLFFRHRFHNELYFLLKENVGNFTKEEKDKIEIIINKEEKYYNRQRWYKALREDNQFKDSYLKLSKKLNTKEDDYEKEGEAEFFSGENSSLSVDEVSEMSVEEIVKYTFKFSPTDELGAPSHTGLAKTIRDSVIKTPNKFLSDINNLLKLPYFHTFYVIDGFIDSWKSEEDINWEELLEYCYLYITKENFGKKEDAKKYDSWEVTPDYILGTISRLITAGTQQDKTAFDIQLLPKTKIILDKIVNIIPKTIDKDFSERNLIEYTLNSLGGKTTFAYLNFLLRKARAEYSLTDNIKWNEEDKQGFTTLLNKNIVDTHIQFGEYLKNYLYIDKEWCYKQLDNYTKTSPSTEYFLSGYMYSSPYSEERLFLKIKPILKYFILNKKEWLDNEVSALAKHIVIYYLWHENDIKDKDTLINTFISNAKTEHISKLIEFISHQRENIFALGNEKEHTEKIISLWRRLSRKTQDYNLYMLITFVDKINSRNFSLIKKTIQNPSNYYLEEIFNHLNKIKNKNTTEKQAEYMAEVLESLPIPEWVDEKKDSIFSLIKYLYKYKSNKKIFSIANDFCNKYAEKSHSFLNELYRKNQ